MRKELWLFETVSDLIILVEKSDKKILYLNPAAKQVLMNEESCQLFLDALFWETGDRVTVEIEQMIYRFQYYESDIGESMILAVGKPMEKKREVLKDGKSENIYYYASLDQLTGLASTKYFYDLAQEIVDRKYSTDKGMNIPLYFIYFDVDNFKSFNSAYGYEEGDGFLRNLAGILTKTFKKYVIGRTSNDHFIVLTNGEDLIEKIEKVHEAVHGLEHDSKIELRAGIYEYEQGVSVVQAHDKAKVACDSMRGKYDQKFCYYDEQLRQRILREKYIIDHIDEAIEKDYLRIYYQPIRRVFTDKVCAMESLVRWDDPVLGFLSPGEFIPVLERRQLIYKLDTYVLKKVCQDILVSKLLGEAVVPISVNLSRLDFVLMDVCAMLKDVIGKFGISPKMIHIEVTESALNEDEIQLIQTLQNIQDMGFEVWLDDFGSEYSTLNTLQNYNFDLLKIDMKFFENFDNNEKAKIIIASIIDMAKRLHMHTLAEGIETAEQYAFLKEIGCDKAQGFFICHPTPLDVLYGKTIKVEDESEAEYFGEIGKVNFLSPNPLENYKESDKIHNIIPTAIVQYKNERFEYLFTNRRYRDCLEGMNVTSTEQSEQVLNDSSSQLKMRLVDLAKKCHESRKLEKIDFIFNGSHVNIHVREIAFNSDTQALFIMIMNMNAQGMIYRSEHLEEALRFLYSIYDRVDMIDIDSDQIDNLFMADNDYKTSFDGRSIKEAVAAYARTDIAKEDREKYIAFYDIDTLPARVDRGQKDYIVKTIRTLKQREGIRPQLYVIIRVYDGKTIRYLSCVRDVDVVESVEAHQELLPEMMKKSRWYQMLAEELRVSVMEWDREKKEACASPGAYRYQLCCNALGDILDNKGDLAAVHPEDVNIAKTFFVASKSGRSRAEVTLRLRLMDGSYRWSRMIGMFEYDSDGSWQHTIGIIIDVEQEHNNFEQAKFLNMMPTALGVFEVRDGVTRQLFMNDEFFKLVEDDREHRASSGKVFVETIHPEDRKNVLDAMKIVIDGAAECSALCRVQTGSGTYKWIRFTSSVAKREENYLLVYSTYVATSAK